MAGTMCPRCRSLDNEVFSEAKSAVFDTKIIRKIIQLHKQATEKRREEVRRPHAYAYANGASQLSLRCPDEAFRSRHFIRKIVSLLMRTDIVGSTPRLHAEPADALEALLRDHRADDRDARRITRRQHFQVAG